VTGKNIYSENVCAFDVNARSSTLIETSRKISTRLLTCFCQGNISSQSKQLSCEAVADLNLHSNAMLLNRCSAEPQGSEPQGSASGCQGFWQNRPNLPGTKLATTVQCSFNNTTVSKYLKMHTSIIAQGSMSNANICGRFCCSNKVEKHYSNVYCYTHVLSREGGGSYFAKLVIQRNCFYSFVNVHFNCFATAVVHQGENLCLTSNLVKCRARWPWIETTLRQFDHVDPLNTVSIAHVLIVASFGKHWDIFSFSVRLNSISPYIALIVV